MAASFQLLDVLSNKLVVNTEGLHKLKQIQGKVFVVSAVGSILSGKSSLLNSIVGKDVLRVGQTTMPTTKGISAYLRQIKTQNQDMWQLLLDVQGFDDSFNAYSEQLDQQLLAFALSVSHVVLYNSFGALDSKLFQRLTSMNSLLPSSLKFCPQFVFVQKDFTLKLTNYANQIITNEQYLQYFISHYKDKQTISKISKMFATNKCKEYQNTNSSTVNLNCMVLCNRGQSQKYNKSLAKIIKYIDNKMCNYYVKQCEQLSCIQFVYVLVKCVQLLQINSSNNKMCQLYGLSQKLRQQQSKSYLSLFKASMSQKCKKQLKSALPMPSELLEFKFNKLCQQCLQAVVSSKNQQAFAMQVIGTQKIQQCKNKAIDKLRQQNNKIMEQLIKNKIQQAISHKYINQQYQNKFNKAQQQQMITNISTFYTFINDTHHKYMIVCIYKSLYDKIYNKYVTCNQKQIQTKLAIELKQRVISQTQMKTDELNSLLSQKNTLIYKLEHQVQQYKQQAQKYRKQIQQKAKVAQVQITKLHEFMKYNAHNSQGKLKEMHSQLSQNLQYERKVKINIRNNCNGNKQNKQEIQQIRKQEKGQIMQSINLLISMMSGSNDRMKQQKNQIQKVVMLQQMNKKLRQRIEQLLSANTCTNLIESKYNEARLQLEGKEKQIRTLLLEKNMKIQQLNGQVKHTISVNKCLQEEISILKQKANDKIKSSQFLQKIMRTKQQSLEQIRAQLLQSMSRYTQDTNALKRQFHQKQTQMAKTISTLILKNQQLSMRNGELQNKAGNIQGKLKRENESNLLQKQKVIRKLQKKVEELENSLQQNLKQYTKMSCTIEEVIEEKDRKLMQFSQQIQSLHIKLEQMSRWIQQGKQKCEQYKQKYKEVVIEKEELEAEKKREQMLASNKIKHMEQSNQKLKVEIQEKQNTFDMMLLQLRTTNVLANNATATSNAMKEESKQKYMKRIDYLEQIVIRELDDLSNRTTSKPKNYENCQPRLSLNSNYRKTQSQWRDSALRQNCNSRQSKQRLKGQYQSDRKERKTIKLQGYSQMKNTLINNMNLSINNSSNKFWTIPKKL